MQKTECQPLACAEIETYHRDGLMIPSLCLSQKMVGRMRESVDRLIRDNPDVRPEQLLCPHIPPGVADDNLTGVRGSWDFLDYAVLPAILGVVKQLIGPDVILWGSQIFCKPAGDGMEVPWHQDGHYWPIRPLATVSAWIALDEVNAENGCMRYVPGTHRHGLLEHASNGDEGQALKLTLESGTFDDGDAVDVTLRPGQFSLHDVHLVHGSNPNRSARRRAGLVYRFMPATSLFDRSIPPLEAGYDRPVDFSRRPIWLISGEDRAGNDGLASMSR